MTLNPAERLLHGTPYLVPGDQASHERFERVCERSSLIHTKAIEVAKRVSEYANEVMAPFETAILSDLVAESNRIEGYEWTSEQVRRTAIAYRALLDAPVGRLLEALRGDERVMEALGLYRAHMLAEEWAREDHRPAEFEIRALHSLIASGEAHAGRYKVTLNRIGGSSHTPAEPLDVPRAMHHLTAWWRRGSGDPILDATVVHAWLTHIHPFEDGNGRMARLLANLALVQGEYPPLLVRSTSDREQYYDALERSDTGDILPLWDLFSSILRRTVKTMSRPGYVRDVVNDHLLVGAQQRHHMWVALAQKMAMQLGTALRTRGGDAFVQGYPDVSAFALLVKRDPDGNSWYLKILDSQRRSRWLLWYGYTSDVFVKSWGDLPRFPSIFVSTRVDDPGYVHPYKTDFMAGESHVPAEIVIMPGERSPVAMRWNHDVETMSIPNAVDRLSRVFTAQS
jgi:hypothetical protein